MDERKLYRTLFISDIHLGTPDCQAQALIDFLREHDAETIYLVGDIVDCWRMRRKGFYWPQAHNDVVQKLLRKARGGTRIVYIPGNHDELLREYQGQHFGGVEVMERDIFETADGKRMLVIHGDEFDMVVMHIRWLAYFGDNAYYFAMWFNKWLNRGRRRLGMPYWSFSQWAKLSVKRAVNYIGDFENIMADEARKHNADGIICGHIHHAANETRAGIHYINTGDWVESCTAIVEHFDGRFELIDWNEITRSRQRDLSGHIRRSQPPKETKSKSIPQPVVRQMNGPL
jgi:UDP-2,3-diacylglucosamine pyrophosphatase LpxH